MRPFIIRLFYRRVPVGIDQEYHDILVGHSTYYAGLNDSLQRRFRLRLYQLLNVMRFSSAQIRPISREIRAVIGCAIIELTFGLNRFLPTQFTNIIVMKRQYMYPGYGQPFLGHVDVSNGYIYLSWEDVKRGYLIPDDAVNVALHEMAHVLEFENSYRSIFDKFFKQVNWSEWAQVAFQKMHVIRAKQNYFLKSYGGINMSEMFAVCVETFFEQPADFKKSLPELYQTLVQLLRQDPLRAENPLLA